eukprot:8266380-Lingulodinium_polyedra.AAC.1
MALQGVEHPPRGPKRGLGHLCHAFGHDPGRSRREGGDLVGVRGRGGAVSVPLFCFCRHGGGMED